MSVPLLLACQQQRAPVQEKKTREAAWPAACKKIVARLDPRAAGQQARRIPPRATPPDPWVLSLGAFGVTLREAPYALRVNRSGKGISALLETEASKVLVVRDPPEEPLADVFALAGEAVPSAQRQAYTRELFGAPPTSFELVRRGYRHGLDDLSCKAGREKAEIPVAISLILKGTGHWAEQVFTLDPVPGLLLVGQRGDRCVVELQVQDRSASTIVSHVSGDRKTCMERAARVQALAGARPAGPPWLAALGQALVQPTAPHWQSLRAELVRAGAAQPSVASVDAMLKP